MTNRIIPLLIQSYDDLKIRENVTTSFEQLYKVLGEILFEELKKKNFKFLKELKEKFQKKETPMSKRQPLAQIQENKIKTTPFAKKDLTEMFKKKDLSKELTTFVELHWKDGADIGFYELIKDHKSEWTDRVAAIHKFEEFNHKNCSNYKEILKHLQEPISQQILELRSSVVIEITEMITKLSQNMKDEFEPFSDYFIPVLLKTTFVTKKAISDPGNQCIRSIIENTRINKSFNDLAEPLSTRKSSSVLRKRCIEYIALALEVGKTNYLELQINTIENSLKNALGCEVREIGKKAFIEYSRHWPERVSKFVASLEPQSQQFIKKEAEGKLKKIESTHSKPIKKIVPPTVVKKQKIQHCPEEVEVIPTTEFQFPLEEVKKIEEPVKPVFKEDNDISIIFKNANHSDVNIRQENFKSFRKYLSDSKLILLNLPNVMNFFLDGISDQNQVIQECLESLLEFISKYPHEFEEYIKLFLPHLFNLNEKVKMNLHLIYDKMIEIYSIEYIISIFISLIKTLKLDQDSLEFLTRFISKDLEKNLELFIISLKPLIENKENISMCISCISILLKNYSSLFKKIIEKDSFIKNFLISYDIIEDEEKVTELNHHLTEFSNKIFENSSKDEFGSLLDELDKEITIKNLSELIKFSEENKEMWNVYFNRTLLLILDIFNNDSKDLKEYSLILLSSLLKYQTIHFLESESLIMNQIFDLTKDQDIHISLEARNTCYSFIDNISFLKSFEILIDLFKKKENHIFGFELLEKLIPKVPIEKTRELLVILVDSLDHPHLEVRKNTVTCLVRFYTCVGSSFWDYLSNLNSRQIRLIRFYISKSNV